MENGIIPDREIMVSIAYSNGLYGFYDTVEFIGIHLKLEKGDVINICESANKSGLIDFDISTGHCELTEQGFNLLD